MVLWQWFSTKVTHFSSLLVKGICWFWKGGTTCDWQAFVSLPVCPSSIRLVAASLEGSGAAPSEKLPESWSPCFQQKLHGLHPVPCFLLKALPKKIWYCIHIELIFPSQVFNVWVQALSTYMYLLYVGVEDLGLYIPQQAQGSVWSERASSTK